MRWTVSGNWAKIEEIATSRWKVAIVGHVASTDGE